MFLIIMMILREEQTIMATINQTCKLGFTIALAYITAFEYIDSIQGSYEILLATLPVKQFDIDGGV